MTQSMGPARPVEHLARRVRELRRRRGLSAAQLAERLQQVGLDWDRSIVANLENGRRASLDVAPTHLLVPLDDEQPYQVTPTRVEPSGAVRDWVRGAGALQGTDERAYSAEIPDAEWRVLSERLKVHRSDQLGTYRERRLAELLAAHPELAEALEADRRAAEEGLARLRRPPEEEGPADG